MAIQLVNDETKFLQWQDITNELIVDLGDKLDLDTTEKANLVSAINEIKRFRPYYKCESF